MNRFLCALIIVILGVISTTNGQNKPTVRPKAPVQKTPLPETINPKPNKGVKTEMKGDRSDEKLPSVGVFAKAISNRIYLRWLPTMQSYWEFGYRDGYVVERINVKTHQSIVLSPQLMPRPAAEWDSFVAKKDRNYSLLYAAIYEKPDYSPDVIQQLNERRQLFHFALFCADVDFKAACMAGLGMIDSTAVPGERYQYVVSHKSAARYKLKSVVSTEVGLGDPNVLPVITKLDGKVKGRVVTLLAPTATIRKTYNQYQIERSDDSLHYQSITHLPLVVTNKLDTLSTTDTLASEDAIYHYRIRGLTVFQEEGPFSKPIRVKAKISLPLPQIYSVRETAEKSKLEVQWLYKDSLNQYIDHYQVVGSLNREGPYTSMRDSIPAFQHITFIKPLSPVRGFTFYIRLLTSTKKGELLETDPLPVVLADDDPPVQPKGLAGSIKVQGELGIVTLNWQPNTDADLAGYFVNRRDKLTDRYHRVNNAFMTQTTLTDTIELRQMQRYVYYTVKAMDFLFKESLDSKMLTLKIPDINPPTSPIIDSFTVADKRIFLHWTRSYSDDVQKHVLYRKKLPASAWEELLTITDTLIRTYTDSSVAEKSIYAYTLIAFDDSQNRSQPATPVVLETPFFSRKVDFSQFTSVVMDTLQRVKLSWACNQADKIDNFLIYRALPNDQLSLVKKLEGTSREWMDSIEVLPNTAYRYVIRAKMQEGYLSGWKETVIELNQ